MDTLLEAKNVSRVFSVRQGFLSQPLPLNAVSDVSFILKKGETLGLVGESGCGKSTLGRMACGLLEPTSGSFELSGRILPVAGPGSWAKGLIQMVFQDPVSSLDPRIPVRRAIAEPLLALGTNKQEAMEKADSWLGTVGLADLGNRYPHQFSGGQRQRIAIARALITEPEVVICDEPVSALDASVQAQILNLLKDLQEKYQPSYLFISHDLSVIGFMCKRILVMYLGQIIEKATSAELFRSPGHPYSAALVAAMPKGEASWAENQTPLPPPLSGELPSPVKPPSGCYFHPRCPIAQQICAIDAPPWRFFPDGREVRCHFPLIQGMV